MELNCFRWQRFNSNAKLSNLWKRQAALGNEVMHIHQCYSQLSMDSVTCNLKTSIQSLFCGVLLSSLLTCFLSLSDWLLKDCCRTIKPEEAEHGVGLVVGWGWVVSFIGIFSLYVKTEFIQDEFVAQLYFSPCNFHNCTRITGQKQVVYIFWGKNVLFHSSAFSLDAVFVKRQERS